MKSFVVIGLGRFGMAIARELAKLGHEVIAIDRDEAKINEIADEVTHAMSGDIHDEGVLRRMGVAECDCAVVAFATSLQDNILVTLLLKELGVKRVIAHHPGHVPRPSLRLPWSSAHSALTLSPEKPCR